MKLSIIVPIYKEAKGLQYFLNQLQEQSESNYEIIFIVDTNYENVIKIIDDTQKNLKCKVRVVFNSKRNGRDEAVRTGIAISQGEYAMIMSVTNQFKDDFVQDVFHLMDKFKSDIIEFNARFTKPIRYLGEPREIIETDNAEEKRKEILAYSYPLEFNKIFRTSLLKEVVKMPDLLKSTLNSRFSINVVMQSLKICKSYVSIPQVVVISRKDITTTSFNPLRIEREWERLFDNNDFKKYLSSIKYNCLFASKFFYLPITALYKNKALLKKLNDKLLNTYDQHFFSSNEFYLRKNHETIILKKNQDAQNYKIYKELQWHKIKQQIFE